MAGGDLALVLHAHLPFIRHPEHRYHLEEHWLYEATSPTYLPLLDVFRGLAREGVPFRMTMSLSPPLVHDAARRSAEDAHRGLPRSACCASATKEVRRTRRRSDVPPHRPLLPRALRAPQGALRRAARRSRRRLPRSCKTTASSRSSPSAPPTATCRSSASRRRGARRSRWPCESYQQHVRPRPRGIWLPECGYVPGARRRILADAGMRFFFVDTHGMRQRRARSRRSASTRRFLQDRRRRVRRATSSRPSRCGRQGGLPGRRVYRDFYRDIGFDLPTSTTSARTSTPTASACITGYQVLPHHRARRRLRQAALRPGPGARARRRARRQLHVQPRASSSSTWRRTMDRRPLVVSPYDAELYGHWWFEGPWFLDFLARKSRSISRRCSLATPAEYLRENTVNAVAEPSPSSLGRRRLLERLARRRNDWIYRHVHRAEARMHRARPPRKDGADDCTRRALNQAARELLLAQSSDWAFIMKTGDRRSSTPATRQDAPGALPPHRSRAHRRLDRRRVARRSRDARQHLPRDRLPRLRLMRDRRREGVLLVA